jgi:SAM-dependent methyltransferase
MPEAYERWLTPAIFEPYAAELARRVAGRQPHKVLELAAGTGVLTRELVDAVGPAAVTATDLNGAMVDFGRRKVPGAAWRQADAMDLPFPPMTFDAVVCQFGVMFFPDKGAAFAECRRVLLGDGAMVLSVWEGLERNDFAAATVAGARLAFPDDPPLFLASIPHGYDLDRVIADLERGGMRPESVDTVTLESRARSAADIAYGFCTGTPMRAGIEARGDLEATIEIVTQEIQRQLGRGPVTGTMSAHIVVATPAG